MSGSYAYVADNTASSNTGLRVIDISTPAAPVLVGSTSPTEPMTNPRGVFVSGDYAYVADYTAGIRIVNIANPTAPDIVATCDTPGRALDVVVRGGFAYVADGSQGLQAIDVSNPTSPVIVGSCGTTGDDASGVAMGGYHAYIADVDDGVSVIDLFPE